MANRKNFWGRIKAGSFVAIPLPSGGFGYGRLLEPSLIAIYDVRSEQMLDAAAITGKPVAFITGVSSDSVRKKLWPVVGWQSLEDEFRKDVKFFMCDLHLTGHNFSIYERKLSPPFGYKMRDAKPEECVGLEPLIMWSNKGLEKRLDEHFAGRPHPEIQRDLDNLRKHLTLQ